MVVTWWIVAFLHCAPVNLIRHHIYVMYDIGHGAGCT